jgi:DNA-binding transcriptional LysR family regulator
MNLQAIELTHLRYFIALADELHFGRAAARLHIAQPPLTRQIRLLESRLGCGLFERNSRSTRLTAAGAQLLDKARAILVETDRALGTIQRLGSGEEGEVMLATAPSLMLGSLPGVIRDFRKRHPGVSFRMTEMASSAILQAVEAGTADLGLIRGLDKYPAIETHLRWRESMVAILPNDDPAAARPSLSVKELQGRPFVFFPKHLGPSFYDELIGYCRRAGFLPEISEEARQWSSIISLVSAGMGVSIGPQSVTSLLPAAARFVPLKGFQTSVRMVGRRGSSNPAVPRFLDIARRRYSGPPAPVSPAAPSRRPSR